MGRLAFAGVLWPACMDPLRGGKAEGRDPADFDQRELARGILVEMEHTRDRAVATRIAMDHLVEDPLYYRKLARIHKD